MDKLTSMLVFTKVAKLNSFAEAAKELGISRAMATKHVMQLENNLGVRLINRTTRRLSLTEVGSIYYERCIQLLDEIEEMELAATKLHTEPRGKLKIAAPPFFGAMHLAPAIADYLEIYPEIKVDLIVQGAMVDLIEEGIDVAISVGELNDSSLISRKLAHSRRVVCGAPKYFEKHGVPQHPNDLKLHNCLVNWSIPPRDNWRFIEADGTRTTVKVKGSLQGNIADVVRYAAFSGLGLILLPTYIVGQDLQSGRLRAVLTEYEPMPLEIYAVYPHRKHLSAKVRTFVDFLYDRLQPRPYWEEWVAMGDEAAARVLPSNLVAGS